MTKTIVDPKIKEAIDVLLEGGLVKQFTKAILERALAAEMDDHLGYERYNRAEGNNYRNGSYNKSLLTEHGPISLEIPRDREGAFEPAIVPKKQTRIKGLDEKILSLEHVTISFVGKIICSDLISIIRTLEAAC